MPQMMEPLMEQVMSMLEQGYPNNEIIAKLQEQGYANTDIQETLNQAHTKASIEGQEQQIPPAPSATQMQPSLLNAEPQPVMQQQQFQASSVEIPSRDVEEKIEEIAESIIEEKWQRIAEDIGDLAMWKEKVKNEVVAIKQEMLRMQSRFEAIQQAVMGRIKEYDRQVEEVGTDVKAVEKLLESILKPLTENVKELKRITEKMKK